LGRCHAMVRKRKIIVYIATSADGFIARPDGAVEWLERPRPKGNYGISTFYKPIDTIPAGAAAPLREWRSDATRSGVARQHDYWKHAEGMFFSRLSRLAAYLSSP